MADTTLPPGVTLRPMAVEDGPVAFQVSGPAFEDLQERRKRTDAPPDEGARDDDPVWLPYYDAMVRQVATTDPAGSVIALVDGEPAGIAISTIRDDLWVLNLLAVHPDHQSRGVGRALLDHAVAYGKDAPMGMILSSDDPRAIRRYYQAGLSPEPMLYAEGRLDRSVLPATPRIRTGDQARDMELIVATSRQQRGAAYLPGDVTACLQELPFFVLDDGAHRGFSARGPEGVDWVVATDEATATELLWAAIASWESPASLSVSSFRAGQDWALDVIMALRLPLDFGGCCFTRGPLPDRRTVLPQDLLC